MPCPPGGCASWASTRLCKPLPPICLGCDYDPGELQMLWFCWRARATGEYGGLTPVDLAPGLIDISGRVNISKIIEYCQKRGPLVAPFTQYNRFGFKAGGILGTAFGTGNGVGGFSGGVGGGGGADIVIAPAAGGAAGGGGGGLCVCNPDDPDLLTVVVCTELDCDADEPKVEITVCGGTPPYTWSVTGGEGASFTQSGTNNRNVEVIPAVTAEVAGIAYHHGFEVTLQSTGCAQPDKQFADPIGCEEESEGSCTETSFGGGIFEITCQDRPDEPGFACGHDFSTTGSFCDDCPVRSGVHDVRTQQMKDDGCIPCRLSMDGLTITVEDDVGATVVTVISL